MAAQAPFMPANRHHGAAANRAPRGIDGIRRAGEPDS
jgi:hypothetical protein